MGGNLTENDMDQLEEWIGTGPKIFTLLYAITRDGCDATTFHQTCDDLGPTVTVLYNRQGSMYGGYTSCTWQSSQTINNGYGGMEYMITPDRYNMDYGYDDERLPDAFYEENLLFSNNTPGIYCNDDNAFLYQLHFNRLPTARMFPCKRDGYSLYKQNTYGPTFGRQPDLQTFTGTIYDSGGYFALNGSLNIGSSYDNKGVNGKHINNGNMNVVELEVYRVSDGQRIKANKVKSKPWRKTKYWNEKFLAELTEEIVSFKPLPDLEISEARILMIGAVGAGKSSFYNTINSIFRGRITQRAASGSSEQSLTTAYTPYFVRVRSGANLNFKLCDTRGLEESQGLDVLECNCLLDGNVPEYYKFNPSSPISQEQDGYISKPTLGDKVHCVVFVLDSTTLEVLPAKIIQKMKRFQTLMNQKGIPQANFLTKVDRLCKDVEKDVSVVFKSKTIEEHVEKASQLLGFPRGNVLPVKNYENEMQLEDNISILALLSLRQILNFAEDYMENMVDKIAATQRKMEKLNIKK